jgi:hypothetical protein
MPNLSFCVGVADCAPLTSCHAEQCGLVGDRAHDNHARQELTIRSQNSVRYTKYFRVFWTKSFYVSIR